MKMAAYQAWKQDKTDTIIFIILSFFFCFLARRLWIYTGLLSRDPRLAGCHRRGIIMSFFLSKMAEKSRDFSYATLNSWQPVSVWHCQEEIIFCLYSKHLLVHLGSCFSFSFCPSPPQTWVTDCHFQLQCVGSADVESIRNIFLLMDARWGQTDPPSPTLYLIEPHLDC